MKRTTIAVTGAGTMGHGIAQIFAAAGFQVTLTDSNKDILSKAVRRIEADLRIAVANRLFDEEPAEVLNRVVPTQTLPETVTQRCFARSNLMRLPM